MGSWSEESECNNNNKYPYIPLFGTR